MAERIKRARGTHGTSSLFSRLRAVAAKSPTTHLCQVSTRFVAPSFVLALAILVAGISNPTASAQTVTYAGSGAVNFDSVNVCPSGKTTPAPCSKTLTLTYNITASGTSGTPQALTAGAPNLDYKLASGSTCSGSVIQGNTCKVNVTFAPIAAGSRNGAVEIALKVAVPTGVVTGYFHVLLNDTGMNTPTFTVTK